jgi:hypothetical protein
MNHEYREGGKNATRTTPCVGRMARRRGRRPALSSWSRAT